MDFTIQKDEFIKGLSRVQSIIEKRTTLPILSNVLLETRDNALQVVGTDLEVGIKGRCEASFKKKRLADGSGQKLFEIVREMPDGEIHFKTVEGNYAQITGGHVRFKIAGIAPDDYPILPDYQDESFFPLPVEDLADMLDKVIHAVGSDETRPYLNGVYFHTADAEGKKRLRAVATDGHRLALCDKALPDGSKFAVKPGVILPRKGVLELKKLLDGSADDLEICVSERNAIFRLGTTLVIIRLVDGDYPDYNTVIPKGNEKVITCSRDDLFAALRRVSLLTEDLGRGVRFSLRKKMIEVSCENPNLGEAHEEMAVSYDAEDFDIGFNARYFLDALGVVRDEDVNLSFGDAFSPVLLKTPSDSGFLSVLMPMRL
ncbi:MAG: DNA polymerase III subunit beta [Deltaproteobacteria bacterium]|nr:DNA polymerase III subunit beta [Deltaproteobacteria bacterium]